jgi:hypothetical protein
MLKEKKKSELFQKELIFVKIKSIQKKVMKTILVAPSEIKKYGYQQLPYKKATII